MTIGDSVTSIGINDYDKDKVCGCARGSGNTLDENNQMFMCLPCDQGEFNDEDGIKANARSAKKAHMPI